MPPSPAIAFRTLPHTRTPITVCALRSVGKAHALRRQTERDQDDQRRTPRALAPPAALCSSFGRQQLTTRALDFAGFWLRRESVKKFFACGGQKGVFTVVGLPCCCLPAADHVVWLSLRRYAFRFCTVACFGVVSLIRGIYCGELCVSSRAWTQKRQSILGAARAAARPAPPQPARRSLRVAVDYLLLSAPISTRCARFPVGLDVLVAARVHVFLVRISPFGASKREKKSGLAGAHGHSSAS